MMLKTKKTYVTDLHSFHYKDGKTSSNKT